MRSEYKHVFILALALVSMQVLGQHSRQNQRLFEKAREAYSAGQYTKAIHAAKDILTKDSLNLNTHLFLADVYHDLDSVQQEIFHLSYATRDTGNLRQLIYYRLGEANFSIGRYNVALDAYKICTELTEDNPQRLEKLKDQIKRCEFSIRSKKQSCFRTCKGAGQWCQFNIK